MEKEILVVFTGGTISSQVQENQNISVSEQVVWQLVEEYEKSTEEPVKFHVIQPFTMLSENCMPANWQMLEEALERVDFSKYRGVIITHGTDTFVYTAALLGYLYGHLDIPMVLIGSNYPLADKRSNGRANFFAAIRLIREDKWKGVFAIFQNKRGENRVYLPTRMVEADSYEDEFSSFGGRDLGMVKEEGFVYEENAVNPPVEFFLKPKERNTLTPLSFSRDILVIHPYPGMNYEQISLEHKPAAVLHELYHSATACIKGGKHSCLTFMERCKKEGIPVYAASVKPEEKQYETGSALLLAGAIPLYNISEAAAYMKLQLAYAQTREQPEKIMKKQWYFEILP